MQPIQMIDTNDPINTSDCAASLIDTESEMNCIQQDYNVANYPRLRTQQACAMLRLSFLKKFRKCKRPPKSLRLKHPQLIDPSILSIRIIIEVKTIRK